MSVEVLNFLCVHVCHAAAYFSLCEFRFQKSVMALLWAAYVVVGMATTMLLYLFFPRIAQWGVFVVTVGFHAALFGWATQGSAWRRCFFLASYLTFFFFSVPFIYWLVLVLFGSDSPMQALMRIPVYAVAIVLWRVKVRGVFERATGGITDGWRIIAKFSVLMCAGVSVLTLLVFPPEFSSYRVNAAAAQGTLCTFVIVVAAYTLLFKIIALLNHERESESLRMVKWLLEAELSSEKLYVAQARQYRHDMRHHSQLLLALAREGNIEKICDYLSDYNAFLEQSALPSFCRHTVANALLCNTKRKFDEAGIGCDIACDIPESLQLSDVEVCIVLGNLLENAFEACRECGQTRPSFSFKASEEGGVLYIETRNSVGYTVRFKDGLPLSTKRGGGTGTLSIVDTLARHGGLADFSQEGGDFVSKVILPIEHDTGGGTNQRGWFSFLLICAAQGVL